MLLKTYSDVLTSCQSPCYNYCCASGIPLSCGYYNFCLLLFVCVFYFSILLITSTLSQNTERNTIDLLLSLRLYNFWLID